MYSSTASHTQREQIYSDVDANKKRTKAKEKKKQYKVRSICRFIRRRSFALSMLSMMDDDEMR